VVLFAAGADRESTNMTIFPGVVYTILLHEALNFVGRQVHEEPFMVSGPIVVPLPVREETEVRKVTFEPEGGKPTTIAVNKVDKQYIAELPIAEHPGFYEIRTDAAMLPMYAAVNVNTRESFVKTLDLEPVRTLLGGMTIQVIAESERVESTVQESRVGRELWRELLYAAVAVLVLEGILALWFTKRKPATD
jgi:hypothetical protein